jgi:plastocyanin
VRAPLILPMLLAVAGLPGALELVAQPGRLEGLVHGERGPARGAVVYLEGLDGGRYAPPDAPVRVDQVDLRFMPDVVAVLTGTTVEFPNSDPILHNVFSPRGPGDGFDLGTYPPGETRARRFTEPGVHVILCHMHPEMLAYVAVVPTPYHAVADVDGRFAIDDVPAGRYRLRVWRARRSAYGSEVDVAPGATLVLELRLGR